MRLIEYDNFTFTLSNEFFLVGAFRDWWKSDTSPDKTRFWGELSYMWGMYSPTSVYAYITDLEERRALIIKNEGLKKDFKESPELIRAINVFKSISQTTSALLLQDARGAIEKIRSYLKNIDLEERDNRGKLVFSIKDITGALKQIPDVANSLLEAERAVLREDEDSTRTNKNIKLFDDGITL